MPYKEITKRRERAKLWAKEHRDKAAINSRKYLLKKRYSTEMTPEKFQEMFKKQNGKCAICKIELLGKNLSVDHNHQTGEIRGLLCNRCTMALGGVMENVQTLLSMIDYINAHTI